jgi:hypothetical protein
VAVEDRLSKSTGEMSQVLSRDLMLTVATIVILPDPADFTFLACLAGKGEMRGLCLSGKLFSIWQGLCRDSLRSESVEATGPKSHRYSVEL